MATQNEVLHSRLTEVLKKCEIRIETANYTRALDAVREAKYIDPQNIYLIALERQLKTLTGQGFKKILTPIERKELLDSIPEIKRRALDDMQRRVSGEQEIRGEAEHEAMDIEDLRSRERDRALKRQKDTYIQRAEESIDRGDYEHALDEIRRIYIIDPENSLARDLESKIQQLAVLRKREPQVSSTREKKKKRRFSLGRKIAPVAIALLLLVNVMLFYFKVLNSPTDGAIAADEFTSRPAATELDDVAAKSEKIPVSEATPLTFAGRSRLLPEVFPQVERADIQDSNEVFDETAALPAAPKDTTAAESSAYEPPVDNPADADFTDEDLIEGLAEDQVIEETKPAGGDPLGEVTVVPAANVIRLEQPLYSGAALRSGIEGEVVVRVTLDNDGRPLAATILKSDHPLLQSPAVESAIRSEYYAPGTAESAGSPWIDVVYVFSIRSGQLIDRYSIAY